jgi:hypothetical protein
VLVEVLNLRLRSRPGESQVHLRDSYNVTE